jgi:hypothetical protein
MAALWVPFDDIYCGVGTFEPSLSDGLSRVGFQPDLAEFVATLVERRSFDRWTKKKKNYLKKITNFGRFWAKSSRIFWTVLPKLSRTASGRFGPDRLELRTVWPKPSITRISDTFFWTV